MKILEFILQEVTPDLKALKQGIKKKVDNTNDIKLLNKIASSLEGTNIKDRIKRAISAEKDRDIASYFDEIVRIILDTDGTVEEKLDFAEGLKQGYVDVARMVSGERVHFVDLLTSNNKNAPMQFVRRVFHALKSVGSGDEKGPGEFALAVMSPQITIMGKGDLKIGKRMIELKASAGQKMSSGGGRLGSTGNLNYKNVPSIVKKYLPNADVSHNLSIGHLEKLLVQAKLPAPTAKQFGQELFGYIFDGDNRRYVDLSKIVNAMVTITDLKRQYMLAGYHAYKGPSESPKFEGVMLMNFASQELQYYSDPEEMANDTYEPNPYIIYHNEQQAPRLNLPAVTLRQKELAKQELPKKTEPKSMINVKLKDYGEYLVKKARQEQPGNDDLWSQNLTNDVIKSLQSMYGTVPANSIAKQINQLYPQLVRPKSVASDEPTPKAEVGEPMGQDPTT
jgi:hypothetical protein